MVRTLLLCVLVVFGCAAEPSPTTTVRPSVPATATVPSPTPAPTPDGAIDRPSGAEDVVLRISHENTLISYDALDGPPAFTLYGDGRVIYATGASNGLTISLDIRQARLNSADVDTFVVEALGPGGLSEAKAEYTEAPIYDATTTVFEVHALNVDKTVRVYDLGWSEGMPEDEKDLRLRLADLATRIEGITGDVANGRAQDLGPFDPTHYRLSLYQPYMDFANKREWPWSELEPTFFDFASGERFMQITAEQARLLWNPPTSAPISQVLIGPDGTEHLVRLRPLLPDQVE